MGMTNTERANAITEKLGGIDARITTNTILKKVTVSATDADLTRSHYVRISLTNLDGIIFFDHIRELEREIKQKFRKAWNFCLMSGTLSDIKISFCLPR